LYKNSYYTNNKPQKSKSSTGGLIMGNKLVEAVSKVTSSSEEVMPDILVLQSTIVNACVVGDPTSKCNKWVLVDTGLENSAESILESTEKRFGKDASPEAIILTHGHFDHVGSAITLANH
jgi:glyoxylase-like metal-dependent hydrolase (beta-lactamase superfamily II)